MLDLVISQFGLMFFDDPMAALTNIRRALRAGDRATFLSWQSRCGLSRGPGMFALAQPDDITTLLGAAGFEQAACHACSPAILLGGGGCPDDSVNFLFDMACRKGCWVRGRGQPG